MRGLLVRSVLLVGCLGLLACSAPDQRSPAASEARDIPGLDLLTTAIAQMGEPDLWVDAGESASEARAVMVAARDAGANPTLDAALATTDALLAWRALLEYGSLAGDTQPDTAELWADARGTLQETVITPLTLSQGQLAQTDEVLLDVLFRTGRSERAAQELGAALRRWPAHPPLHMIARSWRDVIPDPGALSMQLEAQLDSTGVTIAGFNAQALATQGYLSLAWAAQVEQAGDAARAARLYEAGAEALKQAVEDPSLDDWERFSRLADCLVNGGWLRFSEAQAAIQSGGLEAALPALQMAEQDFGGALRAMPEDPDAAEGIALTGDLYYQAGSVEGIRDFFGRVAERFDHAEWWNNHAFFCRETGEYETSYASYNKCIALAPDNPRWVNDTGLILLYHLDRDLDRAEELFRRAWELGSKICENPFVSPESYDDAFGGYTDAMHNLSLLLARTGDLQQAIEVNAELLEISPERIDARQVKSDLDRAFVESGGS